MTPTTTSHALILCHEIWGITTALHLKADTWRQRGFHVIVPSFYETLGLPATAPGEEAAFHARSALSQASINHTLVAAVDALRAATDPVDFISVLGYSMGGSIALWAATLDLPLTAAVTFYGGGLEVSPWPDLAPGVQLLAKTTIPWLGLYGGRDPLTPPSALARAAEVRRARGCGIEMRVYPDLEHAFALDASDARYSASATQECDSLALQHLRGAERRSDHDRPGTPERAPLETPHR